MDNLKTDAQPNLKSKRPEFLYVIMMCFLILGFAIAMIAPQIENPLFRWLIALVPMSITLSALTTFGYAVVQRKGLLVFVLVMSLSIAFLVSASCAFAFPEKAQLGPLTTMLGLDVGFIGFLSSSSGIGVLRLRFNPNGGKVTIDIQIDIPSSQTETSPTKN